MVIGIFGESCTGKSGFAEELRKLFPAEVYTGNDYLRLAKSEPAAREAFRRLLEGGGDFIYVASEREQLALLPESAFRIRVKASLDTIQKRFAARLHGRLPDAVAAMLERKFGMFDAEPAHLTIDMDAETSVSAAEKAKKGLADFSRETLFRKG